jgi:hypothetical protein
MLYDNSVLEVLIHPAQFMSEEETLDEDEIIESDSVLKNQHEGEEGYVEKLASLQSKLKKSRWNVFMFLGLAFLMFGFALFPLSIDAKFDPFTGTAEEDIGLVWGPSSSGEDFMDVPFEVSVKVNKLPPVTENITLQVFALQMDDCTDIEGASNAEVDALSGEKHQYQYEFIDSPVEGATYVFDFDLDFGQYCFYVKVIGKGGTVVDTSNTDIDVTGRLWPNQVIAGLPGVIFLIISIYAFVGAQKVGKKVRTMLEDNNLTQEQIVLEDARKGKIAAGPSGPPKPVAGPGGPPKSVAGPSVPPTTISAPSGGPPSGSKGPANVAAATTESTKSGPPPAQSTVEQSTVAESTSALDGSIFEDAGNGYFYRKMPSGGYEQQIYIKNSEGQYVPYQAE